MQRTHAIGLALGLATTCVAGASFAEDTTCRVVDVRFTPQGLPARDKREALSPQIAVWVEQTDGKWLADMYVTRSVGLLGLGNRPGQALLKSDFRWPYGRRPMALPIWAHHRGKQYGYVVMGGKCSTRYNPNNPADTSCPNDFNGSPADDDRTIAYHGPVSSTEPYFCSPSGWRTQQANGVDVVSCASAFYGSKGWYAPGYKSPYPPRADLTVSGANDHADAARFARDNDVAAISAATPASGKQVDGIRWVPPASLVDGDYVMMVEVNIESDWNTSWTPGKAIPEPHSEWDNLGKDFIGQPSILYKIPFRLDRAGRVSTTKDYAGYGDWRGDSGTVHPPDSTISTSGGSGGDRLARVSDGSGDWRVKVSVAPCDAQTCEMPRPPGVMDLGDSTDTTLTVRFTVPEGAPAAAYQLRYQAGMPITDQNWNSAQPAPAPNLGPPGTTVSSHISGLSPKTKYYVAARAISYCNAPTALTLAEGETGAAKFVTLSGCFIATAAFGSPLAPQVALLRRFRDAHLLTNPLGQVAAATYYALSPSLAAVIAEHEPLRQLAQRALAPIVRLVAATETL